MPIVCRLLSLLINGLLVISLTGCSGGEDGSQVTGESASLTYWEPVNHQTAVTYTVHFGEQSSGEAGSCNYENSLDDVTETFATITGLKPNTLYHFAVSASGGNGYRSLFQRGLASLTHTKDHQEKEKDHQEKEKDHQAKEQPAPCKHSSRAQVRPRIIHRSTRSMPILVPSLRTLFP